MTDFKERIEQEKRYYDNAYGAFPGELVNDMQAALEAKDAEISELKAQCRRACWVLSRAENALRDANYPNTAQDCAEMIKALSKTETAAPAGKGV